jgi:hypothetical protein
MIQNFYIKDRMPKDTQFFNINQGGVCFLVNYF